MPIQNYSVLKGDPISGKLVTGSSQHYQIEVSAGDATITVAVNVQSVGGSEVLYRIDKNFQPEKPADLLALPTGLTPLDSEAGGLAFDYVRSRIDGQPIITKALMSLLPISAGTGKHKTHLENAVATLLDQAIADKDGTIYAFGSSYTDPGDVQGIHDIHMNQGNPPGSFEADNGVWQDGAIFIDLPSTNTWMAVFIAFQTESWNTDNTTGNPK